MEKAEEKRKSKNFFDNDSDSDDSMFRANLQKKRAATKKLQGF